MWEEEGGMEGKRGGGRNLNISVPFFHMPLNDEVVVPSPCLIGAITQVGGHMDPVPVVVVMDTTAQVHFHHIGLVTDINLDSTQREKVHVP